MPPHQPRTQRVASRRPHLEDVLAAFVRGRVARLRLDDDQKRAFRDRDGQLALEVLRHFLGARHVSVDPSASPEPFPLTEHCFAADARALGRPTGIKKCRTMLHRLTATGVLDRAGSYRQAYRNTAGVSGYRVPLYKLARGVQGVVRHGRCRSALLQRPVGTARRVKADPRRRWWQHALFGSPDGLPPPDLTRVQRRRMRSDDERSPMWR